MFTKFLDPKNGVAFKRIFGSEKNKDILIHFLNDMVKFKGQIPIVDVTFLKTVQDPEIALSKTSIVDILCKDEKGNTYIVEMQVAREKGFEKRALYYASKAYTSQAQSGGEYHDLKAVIFLAISDFVMFPNKPYYKSDHMILDAKSNERDLKDFSFTFLELPKFNKEIENLDNMIDKWSYFFKHAEETSNEDLEKLTKDDSIIKRAFDELERFCWKEEELLTYDQKEKYEGAYRASMAFQFETGEKIGIQKGEKIGIQKGEKIGIQKGEKIGIEKGKREALLHVAKSLIIQGVKTESVLEITGLSQEELELLDAYND